MTALAILLNRLLDLARFFAWLPPLLTRLFVGGLFVEAGWRKLQQLDKVQGFFESLGIPAASILTPLVASLEVGCGLLILVGLATRLACLPLTVIMTVAVLTAKQAELTGFTALAGIGDFLYILLFLWLAVHGAGLVSLDALLGKKIKKLGA